MSLSPTSPIDPEPGPPVTPGPENALAEALEQLDRAAVALEWGGPALGLITGTRVLAAGALQTGRVPGSWTLVVLDALYLTGLWALAGVTAGALVRVLGRWLLLRPAMPLSSNVTVPVQQHSADRRAASPRDPGAVESLREQALAEARLAIRSSRWDEAREKLEALAADEAEDHRLDALNRELESAREAARDEHLADLHAAQSVNDPDRVLELHQFLVPLLEDGARLALEAELSGWFLRLIHNRLRTGRIQAELAQLASRIAETFSHTVEGASLRASLPTLRRSAGLCPRCAQPYTGVADACPACLAPAQSSVRPVPPGGNSSPNARI